MYLFTKLVEVKKKSLSIKDANVTDERKKKEVIFID